MEKNGPVEKGIAGKKVDTLDALVALAESYRQQGLTIVFTNGCFDLLHAGHVHCLMDAKNYGDKLIVGINSDDYIRAVKGPPLPIYPENDRVDIVSALSFVDHVYVFSERTVDGILARLKPDFHAKGTDYTKASLPERETVLSYGGEIAIVGGPKHYSTRETIRKIQSLELDRRI